MPTILSILLLVCFVSTAQYSFRLVISSFVSVKSQHTLRNNGRDGVLIVRANLQLLINICERAQLRPRVRVFQDKESYWNEAFSCVLKGKKGM